MTKVSIMIGHAPCFGISLHNPGNLSSFDIDTLGLFVLDRVGLRTVWALTGKPPGCNLKSVCNHLYLKIVCLC